MQLSEPAQLVEPHRVVEREAVDVHGGWAATCFAIVDRCSFDVSAWLVADTGDDVDHRCLSHGEPPRYRAGLGAVPPRHSQRCLSGWELRDESSRNSYEFSDGQILTGGNEVTVRVGCGEDSQLELFWCSEAPVFNNDGDSAILQDTFGNIVTEFIYEGTG